ncbi:ribosomal protein L7/L12 [Rufibacter hautae]|uniref:Uncharacterized protein n=1 Tax=Rufibacter hautae TaxID=2595005 RepID=A0A5B6TMN7_9BACT|nr:ribosomal protein L7/L12 [Rufibacter hautae]KAA3440709.1 hypothetical protein FOA19_08690 [Rufibacter hautae]
MQFHEYFQSSQDYFWRWEEHTEVLTIPKGSTIAYREFVFKALEHLSEQGIPPFGALLLAIIATNHSMGDDLQQVEDEIRESILKQPPALVQFEPLQEAMQFLKRLHLVPTQYTTGNKRLQLFQVLFESCHNIISGIKAKKLLEEAKQTFIHHRGSLIDTLEQQDPFSVATYKKDFRCIGLLSKKFPDADSIVAAMAALQPIPELDLEKPEQAATGKGPDFIEELTSHTTTFQIGSLVKHIWSGLTIQLHHLLPSEQPLGGVSDLSNKGNFGNLLISEFANDDLVFLSRLANNEALYLHRESPPATDKLERVLLLDVSLRSWGTPKTLAYSILVAIANHPKTDIPCTAYAVGDNYQAIHFNTVDEVIDSLNVLEGTLHPAAGLEQFFQEYSTGKNTEVLFICSPDTLRQPAVQKVISEHHAAFKYWITTDQEGTIEFYKNQHSSRKLVQKIQLPLEELWKRRAPTSLKAAITAGETEENEWPILFAFTANYKKFLRLSTHCFVVTPEKKLMKFHDIGYYPVQKGLELCLTNLPSGGSGHEIGVDENGDLIFLCVKTSTKEVTVYNLTTREQETVPFNERSLSTAPEFFSYQGAFYALGVAHHWKLEHFPKWHLVKHSNTGKELKQAYHARQEEIKRAEAAFKAAPVSVLKNLTEVFINKKRNLVFNKHELLLNQYGVIQLKPAVDFGREAIHEAYLIAENEFSFAGGGKVTLNRSGILQLLAPITEEKPTYEVILEKSGPHKIYLVKSLQASANISLKTAKDIVDHAPRVVKSTISKTEADVLKMRIEEQGGIARVAPAHQGNVLYIPSVLDSNLGVSTQHYFAGNSYYLPNKSQLRVIDTNSFFHTHITTFISKVLEHGN